LAEHLVNHAHPDYFLAMTYPPSNDLADLLVHLARLAQNAANSPLTAAQWTALRYFARANTFSRTPSAFSEFHATTRGTASQTVKALVDMGLLTRKAHAHDRRSAVMEVTAEGHAMLAHDPLGGLRQVLADLPQDDRDSLARSVRRAVTQLAAQRGAPTFGTCSDCDHCEPGGAQAYCHCTQTLLATPDMAAFCVDFRPANAAKS